MNPECVDVIADTFSVAPPAGAAAGVCGSAGDQSSPGGTAGRCTGTLLLAKGAGEGQSSVASENHGCGGGGWGYDVYFCFFECLSESMSKLVCVHFFKWRFCV